MVEYLLSKFEEFEELRKSYGRNRFRGDDWSSFLPTDYKQIKEFDQHAKRGEILIGYRDKEYKTSPFTIKYSGERITGLCTGGSAGVGKSVNMANIILDSMDDKRFGMSKFFVDPKNEFFMRRFPIQSQELRSRLARMRHPLPPIAHSNIKVVTPNILKSKNTDYVTHYTNKELSRDDLLTLMNIDEDVGDGGSQAKQLDKLLFGHELDDAIDKGDLDAINKAGKKDTILPFSELRRKSKVLQGYRVESTLNALIVQQAIIDEEWAIRYKKPNVDVVKLLNEGNIVIYQTTDMPEYQQIITGYVAFELRRLCKARKSRTLKKPIIIYMGEFQHYFPNKGKPSSLAAIQQIYDVYRYQNVSFFAECPNINNLNPNAVLQSDYLFLFHPRDDSYKKVLRERGLSTQQTYDLKYLKLNRYDPPSQMAVIHPHIDESEPIQKYFVYPIPPRSGILKEQKAVLA